MNGPDQASRDYWRGVLVAGGPTAIPRWAVNPVVGVAEREDVIPDDLVARLSRLADEMALPVESVLLAAHGKVLAALSGEKDVVTGYVADKGGQPLPCRLATKPDSESESKPHPWRSLLADVRRVEAGLLSHKAYPVDELRRELGQAGPPFEVVFDPTDGGALPEAAVLWVGVSRRGNRLALRLRHRTDAIDDDRAARIAGYHLTALELIAADPDADHGRQTLLSAGEIESQIKEFAGPSRDLPNCRFHELFERRARERPDAVAAVYREEQWTYRELNARANRLGRALLKRGLRREGVVAVVTERNLDWMAAVLATFKAGGVYLPVEPNLPAERVKQMLARAECQLVLTETRSICPRGAPIPPGALKEALKSLPGIQTLFVDAAYEEGHADGDLGVNVGPDQAAYIYFTSGSTGEPKGAMCEHAGMLNHLYAKIEDLGIGEGDVVTQIARQGFDISLWQLIAGLLVGARTLIVEQKAILNPPRFVDAVVKGDVSVMQVVPSYLGVVLSYLEKHGRTLPKLRCVSVTGEALTAELARRWFAAMPAIKLVNAYGLTETSDDTNHEVMGRPPDGDRVPLGPAVRNVRVYVVDENLSPVPPGAPGEIVFSGVCVGRGYVNDPERTRLAFMADPHRKGERLYRSGDFGCWRPDRKLEFHGRRDDLVKVNAQLVRLGDVDAALLHVPGVHKGAVVDAKRGDSKYLVAFYSSEEPIDDGVLRKHLLDEKPEYMVPSKFYWQASLPETANGKADKKKLRALAGELAAGPAKNAAPATDTERFFCEALARILSVDSVPVDAHITDELGAGSLQLAAFCTAVSEREDLPPIAIEDVYTHPTIRELARLTATLKPVRVEESPAGVPPVGTSTYLLCGALQLLSAFGYFCLVAPASVGAYAWVAAGSGPIDTFLRALLASGAGSLGMCALPVAAKWMLVGRWEAGRKIPVWSFAYFGFWLVKTLVRLNPLVLFAGSPVYVAYLRALGAKIGRDVLVLSPQVPACADLLTIGDNAVVGKDSFFSCYHALDGAIHTGTVTIGKNAFVGEMTVLDIGSALGDGAQLGHSSSLHAGQTVPDGERWCGSPARECPGVDYRAVAPAPCGAPRKVAFSAFVLLNGLVISALLLSAATVLPGAVAERLHLVAPADAAFSPWTFCRDALLISAILFFGSAVVGLAFVVVAPRLLNLVIEPGRVYPLYGFRYWAHRAIGRISNVKFFVHTFGDSSFIVHYLRAIGYDLSPDVVQTGSNFGSAVKHDNPLLVSIGRNTMIADGLSMVNADYSNTSFRVRRVTVGPDNFLGNNVLYPAQGRTGANCLLATKVMVPVDGAAREGVGLLGSPCFEIQRSAGRACDQRDERDRNLAAKNWHNLVTLGIFLLAQWLLSFVMVALFVGTGVLYETAGVWMVPSALTLALILRTGYHVLVDRAARLFHVLEPKECSIYDRYFWSHERFWKLGVLRDHLAVCDGTPFKSLVWRLLGVRIGRRVFDDGCYITERTMVSIGDGCTLNSGTAIQSHSQEDGGFKSDCIAIGAGCTLGVNSWVHYGVRLGDGAQLAADSFLMKGAEVPPYTRWGNNPARMVARMRRPSPIVNDRANTLSGGQVR